MDGLDYTKTFSPFIKLGTIRMVITITLIKKWPICQLDVKRNAFLHGLISEDIHIEQPLGMADLKHQHMCASLKKPSMASNKHLVFSLIDLVFFFLNIDFFL